MTPAESARLIEHSLLRADATEAMIKTLCEEALEYGCYSVCVASRHVRQAATLLSNRPVGVTAVCGFPLGNALAEVKAFEAHRAVLAGATEVDMVMDIGAALAGNWDAVTRGVEMVVRASAGAAVKVIIECVLLNDQQKERAVEASISGGAAWVKTSTGFASGGATVQDVALMKRAAKGRARVKAAGGIKTRAHFMAMIEAGAELIGTSSLKDILRSDQ